MNYFNQLAVQMRQLWNGMSPARRVSMSAVLLLAMAAVLGVGYWAAQPDWRVLYTGLGAEDAGAITAKLQAQSVPFRLEAGGTTILVPAEQLAQLRVSLAADNLPGKSDPGFGLFDQAPLGMTPYLHNINLQRALQAELARTIAQIDPIVQARVLIVRADSTPFIRDQKPATASVFLRLRPGSNLNRKVVDGIVALISRSVEGLSRDNVAVVDMHGNLLSQEHSKEADAIGAQLDKRREMEKELSTRAETMLAQAVGPGRAIVRVAADVNFKRLKETRITVSQDGSAKSSESTTNSRKSPGGGAMGSAGTSSNLSKGAVAKSAPSGIETEETTDIKYEVPKTTQIIEDNKEEIQRLTIAALIDLSTDDKDGKSPARLTLAEAEDLIKQAVGFKTGRDEIKVTQASLSSPTADTLPDQEWESLQRWQSIATIVRHSSLGIAALAALVLGWMALRRARPAPQAAVPLAAVEAPVNNPVLDRLALTAQQNPEALARILAQWLEQSDRPERMAA